MSITYGTATTGVTATIQDAVNRESSSQIITISRATPDRLQTWNVGTLAAGSSINLTNNSQASSVCMLSNASACVWTGTTNMDVVEIDSGYKVNYTGVLATNTTNAKGQQSAALPAYNVAIAVTNSTTNVVNKFNSSTFAASQVTISGLSGGRALTVIALASSFLIGTDAGLIIEVEPVNLTTTKAYQIPQGLDRNTFDKNYVTGLSYYNGIVLASTGVGKMYQIDWMTMDLLNVFPFFTGTTSTPNQGPSLCTTSSGVTLASIYNTGTSNKIINFVAAIDYRQTPPKVDSDMLYVTTAQNIIKTGLQNNTGWAIYQNSTIINFTVVPTSMTTQTPTFFYNSAYQQSERMVIIDDGNTRVESDIVFPAAASNTYTVTPGKTVIDVSLLDTGVDTLGSVSRYNT